MDYSENLVGYAIIKKDSLKDLLPRISRFHHYKDIKDKKGYIKSIKNAFEKNKIEEFIYKLKIKSLKDNISVFIDVIEFVKLHDYCKIFASIDDNQFNSFVKLLNMVEHKDHVTMSRRVN